MALHAHFTVTDFVVFSLTLLASMGIGIFYSRSGGAQQNNNEYLMAGRSMASLPVAISVLASFVSSIAILGNPAEVYTYGFQYWTQCFTNFVSVPLMACLFLPVYYNLRLTSSYEVGNLDDQNVRMCDHDIRRFNLGLPVDRSRIRVFFLYVRKNGSDILLRSLKSVLLETIVASLNDFHR